MGRVPTGAEATLGGVACVPDEGTGRSDMTKHLWLVVALLILVGGLGGCSYFGQNCGPYQMKVQRTNALWATDREMGFATADARCIPLRCQPLMAEYGHKIQKAEDFGSTYFFNYDRNDPYRGNDLREMGNFVGKHILMYDSCNPYRGKCRGCGLYCPGGCSPNQPGCGCPADNSSAVKSRFAPTEIIHKN